MINICGFHSFNEVFFDDVRVPRRNIIGERNLGWYYAMFALEFERLVVPIGGFKRVLRNCCTGAWRQSAADGPRPRSQ